MIETELNTPVGYSASELQRAQKRLLEMADHVISIFENNDIEYAIAFGTLLGAVRHEGFIPWDDDFDLFVFDSDYDRAMDLLRAHLPKDMIVHDRLSDPIYWPYWSRVRDLKTETHASKFEKDNHYKYRGLSLDLYRVERCARNDLVNHLREHERNYLRRLYGAELIDENLLHGSLAEIETKDYGLPLAVSESRDDEVLTFCFGFKCMELDDVYPLRKYSFEGREFLGPKNSDALLKMAYGDYWVVPPVEERKPHYSWVKFLD